ncbi:MAG: LuxR C-terminal-related transcriptional regulator [Acidimicrobiales bacterium]
MSEVAPKGATPLMETKLHVPRRRRGVVHRPRLANRLVGREQPALTLVSAPAGFGKTTLLTEWFADGKHPMAWLSLDVSDSDPALFWSYVIGALRRVVPGVGEEALLLLQTDPSALESVVASLINDLDACVADVVVVLDDYHVIGSTAVHESLAFLLEHLPPQVHVVVASRSDPPLPLARMRARGELLEIRAADLRFTPGEASAYFRESMGLDLSDADVDALDARTEGWIAALQLAALSLQGREDVSGFVASFTGDDRFVVDYLAEEVLERQPREVRDFLLQTSVLDRLTGPLCDAVTGGQGGTAMLEMLERINLFVVPLDDRRRWYRYHHLFADVLRARLVDEQPELVAELHLRASTWYERDGDTAEAVRHAVAGRHFDRAAQLIELAAPLLRQSRQEGTLRRWLEALPNGIFDNRPVLAISLVGARMATGDVTGAEPLLRLVESALERSAPPPVFFDQELFERLPAQLSVQRAGLALLAGDVNGTIDHASRALELVEPSDHFRRGSATALLALAYWTNGDLATAERRYTESIRAFIAVDHLADMLGCSLALADIQIAQGKLAAATRTFESGLRWTTEHRGLRGAADMHVGLSEVLIEQNELDAAARHLATSSELGESAGLPQHPYRWRVTMARLCRARGDLDSALELIDEAVPLYDTDFSPPVRPVAALRARVQLARGDLDGALRWATERGLAASDELSYVREFEHITLTRVLIARHAAAHDARSLGDALTLLRRLLAGAEQGARSGSTIEILVLLAAAHLADHDTPAAILALEDGLRRAEPEGHVRLFLHAGPVVTALLRSLASREDATAHTRRVLAAADVSSSSPPLSVRSEAPLVDELSSRELDVLRLLRSDLSGPDIARELIVSLNTVRTHTKNIYMKLGVNNRREAVRRANELGL